ncbi:MAG: hypothetical protein P8X57_09215 [Cyclobacteriaceae bacterium]
MLRYSIFSPSAKKSLSLIWLISLLWLLTNCSPSAPEQQETPEINPAAAGFNAEESDTRAVAIADSVMEAMGGRKAWDDLRYVSWNFFGARDLVWDKQSGRVRIDVPNTGETYLVNVYDNTGKVFVGDSLIAPSDSLQMMVDRGKSIWINDSYWLFMPFKLKDSGVTLKYAGEDTIKGGTPAEVLQLTFQDVGVTPDNKYLVYVDPHDYLVKQWAYFRSADQDTAAFVLPWDNYEKYGNLMLSADRSDNGGPRNVRIYDELPDGVFDDPSYNMSSLIVDE